ncbi:uncharacterized protein LOC134263241 [Saccostrea cucullata]|uniref:uncharacterized protein LOC134263241 n=1 Tax=Saccostrea cuccullata TaxID=36930 RepID=UPI002ED285E4
MAKRYNPSRLGISKGDGLPPEPYFRNSPSAVHMSDQEYNRLLMPTFNKSEETTNVFHKHLVNKLNSLNTNRASKHKKSLWSNRRSAGVFSLFAFGIYLYTMHAMKQEEFLEKLDVNVTKTDINMAKGQPVA